MGAMYLLNWMGKSGFGIDFDNIHQSGCSYEGYFAFCTMACV